MMGSHKDRKEKINIRFTLRPYTQKF